MTEDVKVVGGVVGDLNPFELLPGEVQPNDLFADLVRNELVTRKVLEVTDGHLTDNADVITREGFIKLEGGVTLHVFAKWKKPKKDNVL